MKNGKMYALVLLLLALGAGGTLLLMKWNELHTPWPTVSAVTQGGVTFLGVYNGSPSFVRGNEDSSHNLWGNRWAYFKFSESVNDPINDARFEGKGVPSIHIWGLNTKAPNASSDSCRYLAVPVPEQYSPEYRNGTLVLTKLGKEIGRWQIAGMPKAARAHSRCRCAHWGSDACC